MARRIDPEILNPSPAPPEPEVQPKHRLSPSDVEEFRRLRELYAQWTRHLDSERSERERMEAEERANAWERFRQAAEAARLEMERRQAQQPVIQPNITVPNTLPGNVGISPYYVGDVVTPNSTGGTSGNLVWGSDYTRTIIDLQSWGKQGQ